MAGPGFVALTLDKRSEELLDQLSNSLGKENLYDEIVKFFNVRALKAAGRISQTMLSGQRLKRRTGSLARSITGTGLRLNGVPAIKVGVFKGPALRYAGIQEYGTQGKNPESPYPTIRPKHGKALAIPQEEVLTPAGVERFGGPRGYPGELHFVPFRDSGVSQGAIGGLFSDQQYALGLDHGFGAAKAAYILVAKVDIEAKHYLRDGFNEYMPLLVKELAAFLEDLFSGQKVKTT